MGTPTCYIFPCPADTVFRNAPFNALVPSGTTREPGLLLLSPSGELRYWDSVSDGLAGASHFTTVQLLLFPHEVVTTFIRSDVSTRSFNVSPSLTKARRIAAELCRSYESRSSVPPDTLPLWWTAAHHPSGFRTSTSLVTLAFPPSIMDCWLKCDAHGDAGR